MKKTLAFMTLVMFTATGCLEKDEGGSEAAARDAIPSAEFLKIAMPASDGTAKPIVGQVSPFYLVTLGTALQLNLSVGAFLTLVRIIVAFPVTSIEGDTWVWGPWHDEGKPGEYRLSVRLNEEGNYEWNLEGRKFGETGAFVALVRGLAEPGRPNRGAGAFSMDFELAKTIDPNSEGDGTLSVTYDLERNPITLELDAEVDASTFHYSYAEKNDGSGDLTFQLHADSDDPGADLEDMGFHSRWQRGGAGRADVSVSGGDMGSATVTATECWNQLFRRTYYSDSVAWSPTEGSASSCVF